MTTTETAARIRQQLAALKPNELTYIGALQVARDSNKRTKLYVIRGKRLNLDQAVHYITTRKTGE